MATRNTYIIAFIVAIIVIVAVSAFVQSGMLGTNPYYPPTTSTTTTGSTSSTTTSTSTSTSTSTTSSSTSTTSQGGGGGAATAVTLVAQNHKFNGTNPTITVKAGVQVTFTITNKDSVNHTFDILTFYGDSTGQIAPGSTKTLTVTLSAGTYTYRCADHPSQMTGQIVAQ